MWERKSSAVRAGIAVVLCATMALTGCSLNWIAEGEQIVAVLIPAATNLVSLVAALEGKTVSAADVQLIQNAGTQAGADLQLIQALIAAYEKADAASKPGILNQIQSAIAAVEANLEGLLPALHIKDTATQTKITAVVGMLLAEVQSLAAVVEAVQGSGASGQGSDKTLTAKASSGQAPAAQSAETRVGQPQVKLHTKAPLTAREFVESYNATLTAKTGNAELDRATAGFEIHAHGKLARWATAGVLK
jgi:hypothetical protein